MVCKCGYQNHKDAKYCANCHRRLKRFPWSTILLTVAIILTAGVLIGVLIKGCSVDDPPPTEPTEATIAETVAAPTKETVHQHTWKDATCEEPQICKTCYEKKGSPLGHTWIDATYDAPKTCITCGETSGDILRVDPYSVELPDLSGFFRHKYTENMWGEAHLVTTVCDPEYLQSGFEEYLRLLLDEQYQLELMETRENSSSVDYIFRYTGENDEIEWINHKNGYSYHVKLTVYENKNAISLHTHPAFVLVDSGSTASHIS